MTHSASTHVPAFAVLPSIKPVGTGSAGQNTPLQQPKSAPQNVLAANIALGVAGPGVLGQAPTLPPLLAAPSATSDDLTAELSSAGWQAYLRGMVRDLTHRANAISEEQIQASAAINGARTSGHAAAHTQHQHAVDEASRLEAAAKAAKEAATKKSQEASAARNDATSKAGIADKAGNELAVSQKAKTELDGKTRQAQQDIEAAKRTEAVLGQQLMEAKSQVHRQEFENALNEYAEQGRHFVRMSTSEKLSARRSMGQIREKVEAATIALKEAGNPKDQALIRSIDLLEGSDSWGWIRHSPDEFGLILRHIAGGGSDGRGHSPNSGTDAGARACWGEWENRLSNVRSLLDPQREERQRLRQDIALALDSYQRLGQAFMSESEWYANRGRELMSMENTSGKWKAFWAVEPAKQAFERAVSALEAVGSPRDQILIQSMKTGLGSGWGWAKLEKPNSIGHVLQHFQGGSSDGIGSSADHGTHALAKARWAEWQWNFSNVRDLLSRDGAPENSNSLTSILEAVRSQFGGISRQRTQAEQRLSQHLSEYQGVNQRLDAAQRSKTQADDVASRSNVAALTLESERATQAGRAADMEQLAAAQQLLVTKQALAALDVNSIGARQKTVGYSAAPSALASTNGETVDDLVQRAQADYQDAVREARTATQQSLAAHNSRLEAAQDLARAQAERRMSETQDASVGLASAVASSTQVGSIVNAADGQLRRAEVALEQAQEQMRFAVIKQTDASTALAQLEKRVRDAEVAIGVGRANEALKRKLADVSDAFSDVMNGKSTLAVALKRLSGTDVVSSAMQDAYKRLTTDRVDLLDAKAALVAANTKLEEEKSRQTSLPFGVADLVNKFPDFVDFGDLFSNSRNIERARIAVQASERAIGSIESRLMQSRERYESLVNQLSHDVTGGEASAQTAMTSLLKSYDLWEVERENLDAFKRSHAKTKIANMTDDQYAESIHGDFDTYFGRHASAGQKVGSVFLTSRQRIMTYTELWSDWLAKKGQAKGDYYDRAIRIPEFMLKGHTSRIEAVRADFMDRVAAIKNDHATALLAVGNSADEMVLVKQAKLELVTERATLADATVAVKNAALVEATKADAVAQAREASAQARSAEAVALVAQQEALVRLKDAQIAELSSLTTLASGHREIAEARLDALLSTHVDATVALEAAELANTRAALAVAQAEQIAAIADAANRQAESQAAELAAAAAAAKQSAKEMALELAQTALDVSKRRVGNGHTDQQGVGTDVEAQALVQSAADALVSAIREREAADQLAESARMAKDAASLRVAEATTLVHDRLIGVAQATRNLIVAAGGGELAEAASVFEIAIRDEIGAFAKLISAQSEGALASVSAKSARDALVQARGELAEASAQRVISGQSVSTRKTELRDALGEAKAAFEAVEQATAERDAAVHVAEQLKIAIKAAIADAERATERARVQRELATRLVDEVAEMADRHKDLLSIHGVRLTELLQFIEELLALDTSGLLEQARAALARSRAEARQATQEREVVKGVKAYEAEVKHAVVQEAMASVGQGSTQAVLVTLNVAHAQAETAGAKLTQASGESFFKQLQGVAQQIEAMNDDNFRRVAQPLKV